MDIVLKSDSRHGVVDLGEPWPWGEKLSNCVANQVEDTEPDGCLSDKKYLAKAIDNFHFTCSALNPVRIQMRAPMTRERSKQPEPDMSENSNSSEDVLCLKLGQFCPSLSQFQEHDSYLTR